MNIEKMTKAVEAWAKSQPFVRKAYLFGSRIKGTHRPNSDLDVAVELICLPDESDPGVTWHREAKTPRESISKIVPVRVDLVWYGGPVESPCIHIGLQSGYRLAYDEASADSDSTQTRT